MKTKISLLLKYILVLLPFASVIAAISLSLDWGLPNKTISNIVLPQAKEKKESLIKIIALQSNQDIKKKSSFVIEDLEKQNDLRNKLRIARRYLMYSENPDEMLALAALSGINPKKFSFKLKCFQYGGGYLYPMGTMIALGRKLTGENLNISPKDIIQNPECIASAYAWGRALNIIALIICFGGLIMILYACDFSVKYAVLSSGVLLSSPALINWVCVLKPHFLGLSLFICSAGVILLGQKLNKLKLFFYIAMILAGFACSAQYFMIYAGIIPTLILLQSHKFNRQEKIKIISIGILLAGITFFIFNPYLLFYLNDLQSDLKRASSFYSPEFFSPQIPVFALWMWFIGSGFIVIPLCAGVFMKCKIKGFAKKYNYLIAPIIILAYHSSTMCVSAGFKAQLARFFLPAILLTSVVLIVRAYNTNSLILKKIIFVFLFIASLVNAWIMTNVLNEGTSSTRPFIEASKYLNSISSKYKSVYSSTKTPAPYKMPAFSYNLNLKEWNGKLEENELLVSDNEVKGLKLIKSFNAKHRYFKMSFAEKDFYFYIKPEKK